MLRERRLNGTTDDSGDLTVTDTIPLIGRLFAVKWEDGTFADGVDAVLSCTDTIDSVDITLLTLTDANNDALYYPRHQVHGNTGTGLTYTDDADIVAEMPLVAGVLELVVADGGDTKTGGCTCYVFQEG